jgi:hypothetical protein
MQVRDWNTFITANPSATLLAAVVSSRLPPALMFDKNGKKLPTPYKLFCEWLDATLVGTWSTIAVPMGFVIGVTGAVDKTRILAAYGPARHKGFKLAGKSVGVLSFTDGSYAKLATERGYTLNI